MSGIEIDNSAIKIDFHHLFQAMSEEDTRVLIKSLAVESFVINKVIDYICDEDKDGWWASDTPNIRQKILERIEKSHLKNSVKYNWSVFNELESRLREIKEKQHIYWSLYRLDSEMYSVTNDTTGTSESIRSFIFNWMKRHGIKTEYSSKCADEDINNIKTMLQNALDRFAE